MAGTPFQASLLDTAASVEIGPVAAGLSRRPLAGGAWVDVRRRWVTGADSLFERLRAEVPWRAERRPMYDRTVDVPRLLSFYAAGEPLPDQALDEARRALDQHYAAELGEPFTTVGLAFYRDGRDSVAWHGDRLGRGSTHDTMVAILVLGAPRTLLLRPRPGTPPARTGSRSAPGGPAAPSLFTGDPSAITRPPGAGASTISPTGLSSPSGAGGAATTIRFELGHGDLLVMGGSCQRTWEHAVPKTARPVGPRISVQFRPHDVR
ncbi:alpha-ketoglutarate-dependent dioxygenase AlkB [Pseudofrankia inefficax]|uniref:Putative alkylated DNA repair protein n=1 Tax=Pseudofrankia inefficax (strain DSM 45817 / CECT 9037 / DDB 130130 / EuI1c) TaxID=298654 RepID=E3JAG9_PSEI1|nr:alpha-ketoglutarate-dependent dioxygenase AlkB [Pseudofrankia inefficax]ADP81020.1 putative alkylated DNA repair protein [Pseudofrankia inefficax]